MPAGVIPALLTPFDEGGAVDFEALDRLLEHLVAEEVAGVFITGTTGEFVSLSLDERTQVIRHSIKKIQGAISALVHVGAYNTEITVTLARFAQELNADAVGMLPPYFYGMDEEALYQHFGAVLKAVSLPVYLYNLPQCAGKEIPLTLIARLKEEFSHLAGIKDSQGDIGRLWKTAQLGLPDFEVICGDDESTLDALKIGIRASVTSTGNAFPDAFQAVYDAYLSGDEIAASAAQDRLTQLTVVCKAGCYVSMYKEALRLRGVDAGVVRPPQRQMTSEEIEELRQGMTALKFI